MDVFLSAGVVTYATVSPFVDGMISSVEFSGPSTLTDSALSLWSLLVDIRSTQVQGAAGQQEDRLLQWLFSKWIPSKLQCSVEI
jgi:hypothetical protein